MQTNDIPPSWKVARPQMEVYGHFLRHIDDKFILRIVVLKCGHEVAQAPYSYIQDAYECGECYNLMMKEAGGRL